MNAPEDLRLEEFSLAFLPMTALLLWAFWQPELGGDLELGRTKLTIWATTILLIPALILFAFRSLGQSVANLAHLFWTAAWVAFVVHAYWAIFIIFDGVADTFRQQGTLIAGANFLLLAWWSLDVLLLWSLPSERQQPILQYGVRGFALIVFAITLVVLRGGPVQVLGFVFVGSILLALLLRLGTHVSGLHGEGLRR